jgi:hypothetical protein
MSASGDETSRIKKLPESRVPVVIGNYRPFRLVVRDAKDLWNPTLQDLNRRSYDYAKLHRVSTYLDFAVGSFPMAVCFDGTLALPAIQEYHDQEKALRTFNKVLSQAMLGGVYCEAMSPDDVCLGTMTLSGYCQILPPTRGPVSSFHRAIRTKYVGAFDVILLLQPEIISVDELKKAISIGCERLDSIKSASPETLLYGMTFYARGQWAEALIHLWTSIEQVVATIWKEHILVSSLPGISARRRKDFLEDTRTWTASTRLELLYQRKLLPASTYALVDTARLARNAFAHQGERPSSAAADAALDALFHLISLNLTTCKDLNLMHNVVQLIKDRAKTYRGWQKPFRDWNPKEPLPPEAVAWIKTPPLPGDPGWGDKPYEVIEDLKLEPVDSPLKLFWP